MSQRMPANEWVSSGPANSVSLVSEGMLKELVFVISPNARRTVKPNQVALKSLQKREDMHLLLVSISLRSDFPREQSLALPHFTMH